MTCVKITLTAQFLPKLLDCDMDKAVFETLGDFVRSTLLPYWHVSICVIVYSLVVTDRLGFSTKAAANPWF